MTFQPCLVVQMRGQHTHLQTNMRISTFSALTGTSVGKTGKTGHILDQNTHHESEYPLEMAEQEQCTARLDWRV
jgi:hypothetical protein